MPCGRRRGEGEAPVLPDGDRALGRAARPAVGQRITVTVGTDHRAAHHTRRVGTAHTDGRGRGLVDRGHRHGDRRGARITPGAEKAEGQQVQQSGETVNGETAGGIADRDFEGLRDAHVRGRPLRGVGVVPVGVDHHHAVDGFAHDRVGQDRTVRIVGIERAADHPGRPLALLNRAQRRGLVEEERQNRVDGGLRGRHRGRRHRRRRRLRRARPPRDGQHGPTQCRLHRSRGHRARQQIRHRLCRPGDGRRRGRDRRRLGGGRARRHRRRHRRLRYSVGLSGDRDRFSRGADYPRRRRETGARGVQRPAGRGRRGVVAIGFRSNRTGPPDRRALDRRRRCRRFRDRLGGGPPVGSLPGPGGRSGR